MSTLSQTPMMAQWHACKEKAVDAILFFRLGDFYEAFYEDAETISRLLDLTLTKRQEIPMAGVPHHMCETYVDRLVSKGLKVAIAEQVEDPNQVKGILKREIVRVVTPGTLIDSPLLQEKEQSYIGSLFQINRSFGLAIIDITTGEFVAFEFDTSDALLDELSRLSPKELLIAKRDGERLAPLIAELAKSFKPTLQFLDEWHFGHKGALDLLTRHFGSLTLDGFGLTGMSAGVCAAGALLGHLRDGLNLPISHIHTIRPGKVDLAMSIDKSAQKNLELVHPLQIGQKEATLLHVIDKTVTPMGGRRIRKWLLHPLLSVDAIQKRQDQVASYMGDLPRLLDLRRHLKEVRDLERITMRIETGLASPRDLGSLLLSLQALPEVQKRLKTPLPPVSHIAQTIDRALVEAPPLRLSDGGFFKMGFNAALDELYLIKQGGKEWVQEYQESLKKETGIRTLKMGYTRAFGYYIEVSKGQVDLVPSYFQRRQTLVNGERFVTEKLKEFEYKILSADERIRALEQELFQKLRAEVAEEAKTMRQLADLLSQIDVFSSLALLALERDYVRPLVDESTLFNVEEGRHPVIEAALDGEFIPNDTYLDGKGKQLAIITGPNMAGKSTYIRQAALIAILAQIGSFVPAKKAHIGIIDKVFSRIGASDDLSRGQSTFMVEMTETAQILRSATDRSLVILDEIGRGTSTYDGISIAWAVAEYLLTNPGGRGKTLFATHYFEMTELEKLYPHCFNLHVIAQEEKGEIVFLRKIGPGSADKSYGIHVARLAGIPPSALHKAEAKLKELEKSGVGHKKKGQQYDLFTAPPAPVEHPVLKVLEGIDPNSLTPLQALQQLASLKELSLDR